MPYAGGKGGDGVYQRIISLMPPHEIYIEPFLGGGSIMRMKRPAALNIGIDKDRRAVEKASPPAESQCKDVPRPEFMPHSKYSPDQYARIFEGITERFLFQQGDGIGFLQFFHPGRYVALGGARPTLIYCDPPYMRETCKSRCRYKYDLSDDDHGRLLRVLQDLNALDKPPMLMISGYDSELYREMLPAVPYAKCAPIHQDNWHHQTFQAMTRGGKTATEHLWFNFAPPTELHDYRYLGGNFRDRERIKRRKTYWVNRLKKMPPAERQALLSAIAETAGTGKDSK